MADALFLVPHGRPSREVLFEVVARAKREDALAPVTVAVPSSYAGLSLRRELGSRGGFVNVRFMSLARVAELLGAPYLAEPDRRPLTEVLALGAVHAALAEDPGELAPVARHPATVRSLSRTFADLRVLDDAALDRLASGGGRAPTVVRLYRRVRELTAGYYDDDDQLAAAETGVLNELLGLSDIGSLVVHLPRSLSPAALNFVTAFAERGRAAAVLGLTGDEDVDADVRALAARLTPVLGAPVERDTPDGLPRGDIVVSCPDADEEVRTTVRGILERLENGTPLHRIAVAYRMPEPYARLLHEHLGAAGVPVHGPSTRTLADTAAGRTLLGLLALPDARYRRDAVMEVLTAAPILERPDGGRVPGPRWDRLSCEANVVVGLDEWRSRLQRHAEHRSRELERRANQAGTLFAAAADDRVLDGSVRLAAFIEELGDRLDAPPVAAWTDRSEWLLGLLDRYVGRALPAFAPAEEHVAADQVRAIVESLAGLDGLGAPATLSAVRSSLDEALAETVGHIGAFGDGVLVAPVAALAGTDYDALFLLGMNEGTFPPPPREDPVLPDVERDRVDGELPRRGERRLRERSSYLLALATAPWRALSYPRADTRAQREVRPAAWALETATAHAGRIVGAHELDPGTDTAAKSASAGWLRIVSSFDHAVRDAATPASVQEHDVQSLLRWRGPRMRHPLARADAGLAAGLRAVRARTGRRLDAWDGVIDRALVRGLEHGTTLSPTALEAWAVCPFRYLLRDILRVRAIERPEARDRMSPRDRGTLIHDILEQFLRSHPRDNPEQAWSSDERAELRALAVAECESAERDGLTGRRVLWAIDRTRILRELERVLDTDEIVRAERGLVPDGFEVAFGHAEDDLPAVQVELASGVPVRFRGRIDRVDRAADGRIEVFDYKTGRPDLKHDALAVDPVVAGRRLQLALYGLAVRAGDSSKPVRASYWFTRESGDDALFGFELDATAERRVHDVLDLMADEISSGHFPAYPGPDNYWRGPDNCQYCDYTRLCPPDRVRRFERRRDEPALVGIRSLAEPSDDDAIDEDAAAEAGKS